MILQSTFKAKLISHPEVEDEKTKERKQLGKFTVRKHYRVYAIFDNGKGFTDFLVADNEGIFHWLKMGIFRSK